MFIKLWLPSRATVEWNGAGEKMNGLRASGWPAQIMPQRAIIQRAVILTAFMVWALLLEGISGRHQPLRTTPAQHSYL